MTSNNNYAITMCILKSFTVLFLLSQVIIQTESLSIKPVTNLASRNIYDMIPRSGFPSVRSSCKTSTDCPGNGQQQQCCIQGKCRARGKAFEKCFTSQNNLPSAAAVNRGYDPRQVNPEGVVPDVCPCQYPLTCLNFGFGQTELNSQPNGICIPPL